MKKETKEQIELALDLVEFGRKVGFNTTFWSNQEHRMVFDILSKVRTDEVRRELSLTTYPATYELKVAVNRRGKLIVLEEFPQDEHHAGLHEMIPELEDGEYDIESGIYMADCVVETSMNYNASSPDDSTYLNIVRFTKV